MGSKVKCGDELMFPSQFLTAEDLRGKDAVVIIEKINADALQIAGSKEKKRKWLVRFKDKQKALVLNVTNANMIATLHGLNAKEWVGKAITLYPTKTTFGSQTVTCIRIREEVPVQPQQRQQAKPQPAPTPEDDNLPPPSDQDAEMAAQMEVEV